MDLNICSLRFIIAKTIFLERNFSFDRRELYHSLVNIQEYYQLHENDLGVTVRLHKKQSFIKCNLEVDV